MYFDITLPEGHSYSRGSLFTNSQGISWVIRSVDANNLACCALPGAADLIITLPFNHSAEEMTAISFVNNVFEITTNDNKANYCGLLFPAVRNEDNVLTSVTGATHRAYLLPIR